MASWIDLAHVDLTYMAKPLTPDDANRIEEIFQQFFETEKPYTVGPLTSESLKRQCKICKFTVYNVMPALVRHLLQNHVREGISFINARNLMFKKYLTNTGYLVRSLNAQIEEITGENRTMKDTIKNLTEDNEKLNNANDKLQQENKRLQARLDEIENIFQD